jgi:hypothetical protein
MGFVRREPMRLPFKNTNAFTNNYAIQFGNTGEEQAEVALLNADPSGSTSFSLASNTRFSHAADTPLYQIHYDKVIFKRSTSGTTGTPVALATVAITPDSPYTEYNDTSGAATYAYQTQYYNSVNGDLSGTSAWFVPGGASFYSLQKLRTRGTTNLFNAGYIPDPQIVDDWINEWVEQMTNAALKVNKGYALGTAQYSFGTAGLGTITEPLFKYATKIEITTDGNTWTPSMEIPVSDFAQNDIFSSLSPRHYWQGDSVFGVLPYGSLGTARMSLGKIFTPLTADTDELAQFLRGYTTGCIDYLLYRAKSLDQNDQVSDSHYQKFLHNKADFVTEITPRDQTSVKMINLVEGTGGDDDILEW